MGTKVVYKERHFQKKNRSYKGAPKDIDWVQSKSDIQALIDSGSTYAFIGTKYGVSRQRICQVIQDLQLKGARTNRDLD